MQVTSLGGAEHLDDQGSASELLNVFPESCAAAMLESARLSVSLEGDENFRVKRVLLVV